MSDNTHSVKVAQNGDVAELLVPRFDRAEHFDVKLVVSWNEGAHAAGCGLKLGVSGEAHYAFVVAAAGRAAVSVIKVDGCKVTGHQTLRAAKLMSRALRHSNDTLTIKVRGPKLSFFVNDRRVTQIVNTTMLDKWSLSVFAQGHRNVSVTTSIITLQ